MSYSRLKSFLLPFGLCLVLWVGCDDARESIANMGGNKKLNRNRQIELALRDALTTSTNAEVNAWNAFLGKWPMARQRQGYAWYEKDKIYKGNVSAVTLIEDRYVFKAILDFQMEADFKTINFPQVRFHFAEVKRVILPSEGASGGGVSVSFQPDQRWFGLEDWQNFINAQWDFSSLDIEVISNAPIPHIQTALPNF